MLKLFAIEITATWYLTQISTGTFERRTFYNNRTGQNTLLTIVTNNAVFSNFTVSVIRFLV